MNDLLHLMLDAHGGIARWNSLKTIEADITVAGALWTRKGWPNLLNGVQVTADPHTQWTSFYPFITANQRSSCMPDHTVIETLDGKLIKERRNPRSAFDGHTGETQWDDLNFAYFTGYAMWNYLAAPFMFTLPGVETEEIDSWLENGEKWRRLRVSFPDSIATHCPEQIFYANPEGLVCRMDYSAPVTGSGPIAHYLQNHKEFSGIKFATKRRTFRRNPDGTPNPEPIVVAIDIADIRLA